MYVRVCVFVSECVSARVCVFVCQTICVYLSVARCLYFLRGDIPPS